MWRIDLDACPVKWSCSLLSVEETERASRFRFERDRNRFTTARAAMRHILGGYLAADPTNIAFSYGRAGKPYLDGELLSFNFSHSESVALCAVILGHAIGVDVERIRADIKHECLSQRFFSTIESKALASLPNSHRVRAFFGCWARKEAFIKAQGWGLCLPLDSFSVSVGPERARLVEVADEPQESARWTIADVDPGSPYVGAVAIAASDIAVSRWTWTPAIGRSPTHTPERFRN